MRYGIVGDFLLRQGVLDAAALEQAIRVQEHDSCSLPVAIERLELADPEQVAASLAEGMHLEALDAEEQRSAEAEALLPEAFCRSRMAVPLAVEDKRVRLALVDPLDYAVVQDVEFRTGRRVVPVVASPARIRGLLDAAFPSTPSPQATATAAFDLLPEVRPSGELEGDVEFEIATTDQLRSDTKLPPVVRLVNLILSGAATAGASDVHVEPQETALLVRNRVDGLLQDVLTIPKHLQEATISRIKIMSAMDIAERRRPQDGRGRLRFDGRRIDLRVSSLPTQFGEKIVVRLLDSQRNRLTLDQLNLSEENLARFQSLLASPQGLILMTGPTGSGKTTTLYTALSWLASPQKNIITVEDPIEYQLPGINQVQINPRAGVTFAAGLRSILRQDPNVILVGEIRDQETAKIALEAAQTGHLLLSTLHTNDAVGTITRLLDLGVEPFLVSSSLIAVVSQRLVPKPCAACSTKGEPDPIAVARLGGAGRLPAGGDWRQSKGCPACHGTGMRGRVAVHELLIVTPELRSLIAQGAPEHELRTAARRSGVRSMVEDGIAKAAQGLTTLAEIARVVTDETVMTVPAGAAAPGVSPTAAPAVPLISDSTKRQRVLVVEDSPTIVTVVKYFLEIEGFEVVLAEDGVSGLEAARRTKPDLIVTDIEMPRMDGLELVRLLRADPLTRDVSIIVLTAADSIESETKGLSVGADDYLVKPVEPRRLAARVKALLTRAQRTRPV